MSKFIKFVFLITVLVVFSTSYVCAYSDLSSEHWAYASVMKMKESGIILGYPDDTFRPDNQVTRAELAALITRVFQPNASDFTITFEDVKGIHWAEENIDLANKFLTGYKSNGKYYFKPDEFALREDITVALVKAMEFDIEDVDENILNRFVDKEDISENLTKYVAIAVEEGLIAGYPDGTFKPESGVSRAEVAVLFHRVYEAKNENKEVKDEEDEKIVVDDLEDIDTDMVYGDLNGDGIVDYDDADVLDEYLVGMSTLSAEQKELADVFEDGEIDKMDNATLLNYVAGRLKELPHVCGSYEIINEIPNDNERHKIKFKCDCGITSQTLNERHSFINGKCLCGAKETKEEGNVVTWNGEYVSNINGLTKVKLTKISNTEVNFYIKGMNNTGFFGANNSAEIVGDTAKYTYEIFDDIGEIIFRFEGSDLIIETSGYEELAVLNGTYKLDDGSVSEIEWTIQKNPIEGEYLLGEEIEAPNVESYEELVEFLQTAPTSVTLTISDVNETSSAFSIGGFANGSMIAYMGSLEKVGDKWKYFDESEEKYVLEISFENGKAIVTELTERLNGTYVKKSSVNEYEKYEKAIEESSVGEGVFIF